MNNFNRINTDLHCVKQFSSSVNSSKGMKLYMMKFWEREDPNFQGMQDINEPYLLQQGIN